MPRQRTFKLLMSTLAAAFGVQNKKNLEDDFQQTSPVPFILAGILFTVIFVLALVGIVNVVLTYAA